MFRCHEQINPPELFQEMLWRLGKSEEEYFEILEEAQQAKAEYYVSSND